jgi:hypothetical protein
MILFPRPFMLLAEVNILVTTALKPEKTFYIKGYKLDNKKIRNKWPREEYELEETGSYETTWHIPIIEAIPESAYKYVGLGVEDNGGLNLVLVIDDGYDMSKLEVCRWHGVKHPDTLPKQALEVLTLGIWPSWD